MILKNKIELELTTTFQEITLVILEAPKNLQLLFINEIPDPDETP